MICHGQQASFRRRKRFRRQKRTITERRREVGIAAARGLETPGVDPETMKKAGRKYAKLISGILGDKSDLCDF